MQTGLYLRNVFWNKFEIKSKCWRERRDNLFGSNILKNTEKCLKGIIEPRTTSPTRGVGGGTEKAVPRLGTKTIKLGRFHRERERLNKSGRQTMKQKFGRLISICGLLVQ